MMRWRDQSGYEWELPRLYGRALRFVVVDLIRTHGTMTVRDMVAALAAEGYPVSGRPSKVVSDALRWEIARGRVVRVARGVYRYRSAPPTTARRIRSFASQCLAWISALAAGEEPPPTPPDRRPFSPCIRQDPRRPPWLNTAWLWTV
ncbi:MAG: hypothetical protein AAF467_27595 [Actinomycetota bacterium]